MAQFTGNLRSKELAPIGSANRMEFGSREPLIKFAMSHVGLNQRFLNLLRGQCRIECRVIQRLAADVVNEFSGSVLCPDQNSRWCNAIVSFSA